MIEVRKAINPNYREYKNYALVVLNPEEEIAVYAPYKNRSLSECSLLGRAIATNLVKILGIGEIFLKNGSVSVVKGDAYDWEIIEPQVIFILESLIQNPDAELFLENKEESPKCIVMRYLNPFCRSYHLNRLVYPGNSWGSILEEYPTEKLESPIKEVVEKLRGSKMIRSITLGMYSIDIIKSRDYEWEDVETFLKSVLKELFNFPIENVLECLD